MGYSVRRAAHGGDRRHGRSLAETLSYGKGIDEPYDEAVGPRDMTRRPHQEEWGPRAEGLRIFDTDETVADLYKPTGKGKVKGVEWDNDTRTQYERYYDEEQRDADEALGWGFI